MSHTESYERPTATGSNDRADWGASDYTSAVYGAILAATVIVSSGDLRSPAALALLLFVSGVVFWLAHVYAQTLSHHLKGAKRLEWPAVKAAMVEERPLLEGPLPLLVVLVLGELHVLEGRTAVRLALWIGVAELVTWGILYARRQRWSWPSSITAGAGNGLLGLAIVLLEVVVH